MNYLSVDGLSKSYGDKLLFKDISFGLAKGRKVALVAKNGSGKTTLMNILTEKDTQDSGSFAFSNDITIGFLEQQPHFPEGLTSIDYVFQANNPTIQAVRQYEKAIFLQEQAPTQENMDSLQEATLQMDNLGAWDFENKVKTILSALNITDLEKPVIEMSGGQQKRVALARVLIEEPDLLVLDEPTNHLDLDMVEWLEGQLSKQHMTLLLVTHDRYFLDRICDEILELEGGGIHRHQGNYEYYLAKKNERLQEASTVTEKAKNLMKKELEWVRRMPKARGTKAKYRLDAFEDLKEKASRNHQKKEVQLDNRMNRLGGKVLEVNGISKSFDGKQLVTDFSYVFKRKERVGIVGPNGVGKSTFLNLLTSNLAPDTGTVDKGQTIVFGYYKQEGLKLKEDKRVIEVVQEITEVIKTSTGKEIMGTQLLQRFLFPPEQQHAYVSTLSGGEKRRLYLLTVLLENPNFLILDEPTNDLDLPTMNVLEDYLEDYEGCLILVSHDRYFLDKLADHLFIFKGNGEIRDFNGHYSEYRASLETPESKPKEEKRAVKKVKETAKNSVKKRSFKEQKEYEQLEEKIAELEDKKESLNQKLSAGSEDYQRLQEWAETIEKIIEEIDQKTERWMELDELPPY